jgi:hypothetical protein
MKIKLTILFLILLASLSNAYGGAISGKLLKATGKPLVYTEIELVPVDSDKVVIDTRLNAISSGAGVFTFSNVPDGKYTLSINFDDKPTDLSPYREFFYPATPNRHDAQVFEIDSRSKFTNLVFRLPPPLLQRKIVGKAVLTDGVPVPNAFVALRDVSFDTSILYTARTDKNGNFSVTAFEGRGYQFGAVLFEKDYKNMWEARGGEVVAAGESDIFTLDAATPVIRLVMKTSADFRRIKEKYIGMTVFKTREVF